MQADRFYGLTGAVGAVKTRRYGPAEVERKAAEGYAEAVA